MLPDSLFATSLDQTPAFRCRGLAYGQYAGGRCPLPLTHETLVAPALLAQEHKERGPMKPQRGDKSFAEAVRRAARGELRGPDVEKVARE